MGDRAHWRCAALVVDVCNGLSPYIEHQCIDELEVVAIARLIGHLNEQNKAPEAPDLFSENWFGHLSLNPFCVYRKGWTALNILCDLNFRKFWLCWNLTNTKVVVVSTNIWETKALTGTSTKLKFMNYLNYEKMERGKVVVPRWGKTGKNNFRSFSILQIKLFLQENLGGMITNSLFL